MECHQEIKDNNICYTNNALFQKKLDNFIKAYKQNKKSVAVVTDFDYTITSRYNYETGESFKSCYYLYDDDIVGGNQKEFDEKLQNLTKEYSKYEFSTSFDFETRMQKTKEWYTKVLSLYANEKLTENSLDKMVEKNLKNLLFRRNAKKYIELLLNMEIPIIIVSGGITQFIIKVLKTLIKDVEKYIDEKKIYIVSNSFKFDHEKNHCVGLENEVIYCFNKAEFLGNNVNKMFPELTHILVLGDNLGDADSVNKINVDKENIIGVGFLNLPPDVLNDNTKNDCVKNKVEEYQKVYDVVLVGDIDYQPIINLLKKF